MDNLGFLKIIGKLFSLEMPPFLKDVSRKCTKLAIPNSFLPNIIFHNPKVLPWYSIPLPQKIDDDVECGGGRSEGQSANAESSKSRTYRRCLGEFADLGFGVLDLFFLGALLAALLLMNQIPTTKLQKQVLLKRNSNETASVVEESL